VSPRALVVVALVLGVSVAAVVARVAVDGGDEQTASECAAAGVEKPLPRDFPPSFPLPPGTRVTQAAVSAAGSFFVQASAPLSAPEAVSFYRTEPARAGWRSAAAREREGAGVSAAFRGHGYSGTWTVDEIAGCPAAALLTLRLQRA
jgi:hypothetical protein